MVSEALTVLEIVAILTPLVAIVTVQFYRNTELLDTFPEFGLQWISQTLVAGGFLLLGTIFFGVRWAVADVSNVFGIASIFLLGSALSMFVLAVALFPILLHDGQLTHEQQTLNTVNSSKEGLQGVDDESTDTNDDSEHEIERSEST